MRKTTKCSCLKYFSCNFCCKKKQKRFLMNSKVILLIQKFCDICYLYWFVLLWPAVSFTKIFSLLAARWEQNSQIPDNSIKFLAKWHVLADIYFFTTGRRMSEQLHKARGADKQTVSKLSGGLWRWRRLLFHQEECARPDQAALQRLS